MGLEGHFKPQRLSIFVVLNYNCAVQRYVISRYFDLFLYLEAGGLLGGGGRRCLGPPLQGANRNRCTFLEPLHISKQLNISALQLRATSLDRGIPIEVSSLAPNVFTLWAGVAVERIRHNQDSQGQNLALA